MSLGNMQVLSMVSSREAERIFVRQEMGAEGHLAQSFAGENKPKFANSFKPTWKENSREPLSTSVTWTNQTMLSMLPVRVFCWSEFVFTALYIFHEAFWSLRSLKVFTNWLLVTFSWQPIFLICWDSGVCLFDSRSLTLLRVNVAHLLKVIHDGQENWFQQLRWFYCKCSTYEAPKRVNEIPIYQNIANSMPIQNSKHIFCDKTYCWWKKSCTTWNV